MKFGWELKTGVNLHLTSWKNSEDPSPGEYTYGFGLHGIPQIFIWKDGSKHYRSGPWNGKNFGGIIFNDARYPFGTNIKIDATEVYYEHHLLDNSSLFLAAIDYTGVLHLIFREKNSNNWSVLIVIPQDFCGVYAYCGPNGICEISDTQLCSCMPGYVPTYPYEWNVHIWSGGCVLDSSEDCSKRVHFKEYDSLKVPDLLQFKLNNTMNLEECKAECLRNCSCSAFANSNIDGRGSGSGCLLWFGDLIDVRTLGMTANQKLYIRVSAEYNVLQSDSRKKRKIVIVAVTVAISISLLSLASILIWKRKSQKKGRLVQERDEEEFELPYFDIVTLTRATQDYSITNKIGKGGFGPVYKGRLESGLEIAVKRLSKTSNQGLDEFKNEVMLIAKLQHRNLVRLHGCCIHGEERMLVYEYMPNGSLDCYIFGRRFDNNSLLAWRRRFSVITGIARGILYLHRDSRLRIIHRDLKASNVLLDSEMNPKISDFGLARTFGEDFWRRSTQNENKKSSCGYMSPEYAIEGVYSMKSDVFSFGVLVLEIVTGKRNNRFRHPDHDFNLLGHAWQLWLGGRSSELIDKLMEDSFTVSEVKRCIQIGLLCVQQRPEDRPTMATVLLMLDSESAILPQPKRPGYYTERFLDEPELPSDGQFCTVNGLTDTMIHGR